MKTFIINYDTKDYKDKDGNIKTEVEVYDYKSLENGKETEMSVYVNLSLINTLLNQNANNIHNRIVTDFRTDKGIDTNMSNKDELIKAVDSLKQSDLEKVAFNEMNIFTTLVNNLLKAVLQPILGPYCEKYIGSLVLPIIEDDEGDSTIFPVVRGEENTHSVYLDLSSDDIDPLPKIMCAKKLLDNALHALMYIIKDDLESKHPDKQFIKECGELMELEKQTFNNILDNYLQEYKNML